MDCRPSYQIPGYHHDGKTVNALTRTDIAIIIYVAMLRGPYLYAYALVGALIHSCDTGVSASFVMLTK